MLAAQRARRQWPTWGGDERQDEADVTVGTGLTFVNGVWTHPLGDEYAKRVLAGDIPLVEARLKEQVAHKHRRAMLHAFPG